MVPRDVCCDFDFAMAIHDETEVHERQLCESIRSEVEAIGIASIRLSILVEHYALGQRLGLLVIVACKCGVGFGSVSILCWHALLA